MQVSGSVGKGLAIMSMDQEYVNRFHQQPLTYQQRLLQGLQAAGVGSYEGVIGELLLSLAWATALIPPDLMALGSCSWVLLRHFSRALESETRNSV